jgi:hypothetical protein
VINDDERVNWTGPGGTGTGWVCDTCGEKIEKAADGFLEWISGSRTDANGKPRLFARDVRLVHHIGVSPLKNTSNDGCYRNDRREMAKDGGITAQLNLQDALGEDGLIELLGLVESEKGAEHEFLVAIQRLHVRGYEDARPFFQQAIEEGVIEVNRPQDFYNRLQIDAVLEEYEDQEEETVDD